MAIDATSVTLRNVAKHYGNSTAVEGVDLTIRAGEFVSMLGPSGSGKTTTLKMIAGFEAPSTGQITFDGVDVTNIAPEKRNIGVVFQNYSLFPHLTVGQNVAFPLKMRKVPAAQRDERVARALELVELPGFEKRKPDSLSGGQQQRVAIARALVFEPTLLVMDEPLGALDRRLREVMQLEIKALHDRLGVTVIYVTHDQEEALTMSDRIIVFSKGKIEQVGTPREVYDEPATEFVADFVGESLAISATWDGNALIADTLGVLAVPGPALPAGPVRVLWRPHAIGLTERPDADSKDLHVQATVLTSGYAGGVVKARISLPTGDEGIVSITSVGVDYSPGATIDLYLRADRAIVLPTAAGKRGGGMSETDQRDDTTAGRRG
ncbi:MAG: transporter ATP-binding protein [Klenkia sp.]|nr:transporter ATP-binding protein [Klenkia sp.]